MFPTHLPEGSEESALLRACGKYDIALMLSAIALRGAGERDVASTAKPTELAINDDKFCYTIGIHES